MAKKKSKTMLEVTRGYEKFAASQELDKNGKSLFNKVLKKASKPKPRATK